MTKLVTSLSGMDAKLNQYQQGEEFIAAVESVGGTSYLNRAFEGPDMLPTLAEIRTPQLWMDRVARPVAV